MKRFAIGALVGALAGGALVAGLLSRSSPDPPSAELVERLERSGFSEGRVERRPKAEDVPAGAETVLSLRGSSRPQERPRPSGAPGHAGQPDRLRAPNEGSVGPCPGPPAPEDLGIECEAVWVRAGGKLYGRLIGTAWIRWGDQVVSKGPEVLRRIPPPGDEVQDAGRELGPEAIVAESLADRIRAPRRALEIRAGAALDLGQDPTWSLGATWYPRATGWRSRVGYALDVDGAGTVTARLAIRLGG